MRIVTFLPSEGVMKARISDLIVHIFKFKYT